MKTVIAILVSASLFAFTIKTETTKYFTREANVSFFSDTPLEKIEAKNMEFFCSNVEDTKMHLKL